ncbi:MAG: LacI family DNA-binding transcriptional regulator [Bacteroidales bacterium]|jgi:LacI family transcriptional regulator|nr:LacI family DNA-binding transcriptional regulator [Bacteroidales bacterium]MBP7038851.1 LacI family DNA-binding transcriptional regulator [Bacteroidales bacterium]MDI9552861.1 LacI family DNA-binding transcriptional regulator [Bacteroidota bacterium]
MGKRVKNKDLAEKLGVSSTLVSLVLNNKADQHGIRKETKEKVLALARQMGYFDLQRDPADSSSAEEKPGIIGMVVPSLHDPFVYGITPYLQRAFGSIGVGFSIMTKDPDDGRYNRMVGAFKKFYSGLILAGDAADEYTIRSLRAMAYPFVLLEKSVRNLRLNTVGTDYADGARKVVDHVVRMGYKNILIATDRLASQFDRQLISILKDNITSKEGISKPFIVEFDMPVDGGEIDQGQIDHYLRPPYSAEIIIVVQADLVYSIMSYLRRKNLRVPQDVAIVSMEEGIGFDLMSSPVTCLRRPLSGMALKVSNMIWSEVRNAGKSKYKRQVTISPELIVRKSCGTI